MATTGTTPETLVSAQEQLAARAAESQFSRFFKRWWLAYAMMTPLFLFYFVFVIVPVIASFFLSFTYYNILEPPAWIGWNNYRLLFLEDDVFLIAIGNTLKFALVTGPLGFFLSFLFAWTIKPMKARTILALAFYTPSITAAVAMSVVWKIVFAGDRYGYLNHFLLSLGILEEPYLWLSNIDTMMPIVMFVALWMSMGNGFLVFLAGLMGVNQELYEAGKVDGVANPIQEIWHITLPMMKPQLLFGSVMAIVAGFGVFSIATALTGLPSPLYAAHTIVTHLYDFAFIRFEMGYASTIAVVLFLWTFGLSRILFKVLSSKDIY